MKINVSLLVMESVQDVEEIAQWNVKEAAQVVPIRAPHCAVIIVLDNVVIIVPVFVQMRALAVQMPVRDAVLDVMVVVEMVVV